MVKNILTIVLIAISVTSCSQQTENMNFNKLSFEEKRIIEHKGTEPPFSGIYNNHFEKGIYICKKCDAPLYNSSSKFDGHCGWPSFDDEVTGAVKHIPDADGHRTEIVCHNCGGHLGHVFFGEEFTVKNTRHCVNSISLNFVPDKENQIKTERAVFASGCFWGTEHQLKKVNGVISTQVGYIGGTTENPTYKEVCSGKTGYVEAIEVVFDPMKTSYEELAKFFFETHDPTQINRQGPDIGTQYRSEIFFTNETQKEIALHLINILNEKGYKIATKVNKAGEFYIAEDYHQDYYFKSGGTPYCHSYRKLS